MGPVGTLVETVVDILTEGHDVYRASGVTDGDGGGGELLV